MPIEYIERSRGAVIADMLNYKRVLNNESQEVVAGKFGLKLSAYSAMEQSSWARMKASLLPIIEEYLGCESGTLVDRVSQIVFVSRVLKKRLGLELMPANHQRSYVYRGHLQLRRGFTFRPLWALKNFRSLDASDLPYSSLFIKYDDFEAMIVDQKIKLIESLAKLPFLSLLEIHNRTSKNTE